jgi:hypothetical protein
MEFSSSKTGSTDFRDTEVQQPKVAATPLTEISSRAFSGLQLHFGFLQVCLGGLQSSPERARIDLEEKIALFHVRAFLEGDFLQDARHLGTHRSHPNRLHGTDSLNDERHFFPLHGARQHGSGTTTAFALAGLGTCAGIRRFTTTGEQQTKERNPENCEQATAAKGRNHENEIRIEHRMGTAGGRHSGLPSRGLSKVPSKTHEKQKVPRLFPGGGAWWRSGRISEMTVPSSTPTAP